MSRRHSLYAVLGMPVLCALTAHAQSGKVERGKYLTEEVAHCQVCHTKHLAGGELDHAAWLKGGVADVPGHASKAPDITSGGQIWKTWGEAGMSRYLQTGKDPAGKGSGSHMPAYRLRPDDAEAIASYLRSLK